MSKYKVIVTARSFGQSSDEPFKILMENNCEVFKNPNDKPLTAEELIPLVQEADAIIVGNDTVNADVINAGKKLKVISRYGVGYDNVDLSAAKQNGIIVTNTPNTNNDSVADLAFSLILSLARHVPNINNMVKNGKWKRIMGTQVFGKTLGVIGLGKIGKGLVQRAKGFNMDILCYEMYPDYEFGEKHGIKYCSLEEVLKNSDFISTHVPLTPQTRSMIGEEELSLMKQTAFIINTARGGIIDEAALYNALLSKSIAGAGLDVTEKEPPVGSPLLTLDNIIMTSHIGGYTTEAVNNMGVMAAENVVQVLNSNPGISLKNVVEILINKTSEGIA